MSVSTRNTVIAASATLFMAGLAYAGGGMGSSSCDKGCGPKGHGVVIPGATVGLPTVNQGGRMGKGTQVVVPNVSVFGANVQVSSPTIAVGGAGVAFGGTSFVDTGLSVQSNRAGEFSGLEGQQFISSGGFYSEPSTIAPSVVDGLYIDGNNESYTDTVTEQVPTTQTTCVNQGGYSTTYRPVQAVCVDDKGTPHPASRPSADERVDVSFEGEVFRCMAGTSMQVIIGNGSQLAGGATSNSFQNASGFSCAKGEALVHRRGGELVCQPQVPQRNCNERSLLRRNGPGVKLIQMRAPASCVPTTTTVMETVTRQVQRTRPAKTAPMVFDGGVGQSVY